MKKLMHKMLSVFTPNYSKDSSRSEVSNNKLSTLEFIKITFIKKSFLIFWSHLLVLSLKIKSCLAVKEDPIALLKDGVMDMKNVPVPFAA